MPQNKVQKTYWKGPILLYSLTQLRIGFKDFFYGTGSEKKLSENYRIPQSGAHIQLHSTGKEGMGKN